MLRLLTVILVTLVCFSGVTAESGESSGVKNPDNNSSWLDSEEEQFTLSEKEQQWLAKKHTVRVRVSYWPPYMFKEPEPAGISVDYMKFIATRYGINIQLIPDMFGWSYSLKDLRTNRRYYDLILTMTPTEERRKNFAFTESYLSMPWVIFTAQEKYFISSIDDLKGKTVAVERNFVMHDKLKHEYPDIRLNVVDTSLAALKSVVAGESVAYIGNLGNSTYLIREYGFNNVRIAAPTPFDQNIQVMAVRKDWPELTSIINKGLHRMSQKEHDDLKNQWLSVRYDYGIRWLQVVGWGTGIVLIAAIIIGVVISSNRKLNKEIEQREQAEEKLGKYIQVVDNNVMIIRVDVNGIIEKVSGAFCRACEYNESELLGYSYQFVLSQDIERNKKEELCKAIADNKSWTGEFQLLSKHSKEVWVSATLLSNRELADQMNGYTFIFQDISDKKQVELLSITDKLTGLFNRLKLEEVLGQEIARAQRYGSNLSISMIDIDHFKQVNDTYGHRAGDVVLESFACILKESLRKTDIIGRWGGEEFLIICPHTESEGCVALVEKLRQRIEHHYFNGVGYKTASFGVTYLHYSDNQEVIVNRADEALYLAKDKGRNCVVSL